MSPDEFNELMDGTEVYLSRGPCSLPLAAQKMVRPRQLFNCLKTTVPSSGSTSGLCLLLVGVPLVGPVALLSESRSG